MNRRNFVLWGSALADGLSVPVRADWAASLAQTWPGRQLAATQSVKSGGTRLIPVRGARYRVWVKRVGSSAIKVLLLHGGPGLNHIYFQCFEGLLPQAGIEFWYYDQVGSLFPDNPDDRSLWIVEGYRDEVDPDEMRNIATLMPDARASISSRGSHLAMYDDQQWYFHELGGFLNQHA